MTMFPTFGNCLRMATQLRTDCKVFVDSASRSIASSLTPDSLSSEAMASASEGGCLPTPPLTRKNASGYPLALASAPLTRRRIALLGFPPSHTAAPRITNTGGAEFTTSVTGAVSASCDFISPQIRLDENAPVTFPYLQFGPLTQFVRIRGIERKLDL